MIRKRRVGGQKGRVVGQKERVGKKMLGDQKRRVVGENRRAVVRKEWLWIKNQRSGVKLNSSGGQKKWMDSKKGCVGQKKGSPIICSWL